ncbi:MAG: molybdopterin-dependent oxidoreductase, partial [Congregibacter sp.]|nr:molybdopterin-dependent oxidoreductase [Congregibacter sp.]
MKHAKVGVSRRSFLAGSLGTGLMMGLGVVLPGCSKEQAVSEIAATGASRLFSPAVWFEINEAGEVLVNIAKAEMGQHVGTALARIVADELGASWESVRLAHVDTDPRWGYMVTGGSWSVTTSFEMLSRAGAAGRTVLIDAAAALMNVDAMQLSAENGRVSGAGQSLSFADIVSRGDISRSFNEDQLAAMPIKPASARTLIGKPALALDVPAKSTGEAVYGLDAELPGMVYAHPIVAPTRYGSVITSVDDSAAKAIPGYQQTLVIEDSSGFVQGMALVIADSFPAAMKASEAVKVDWSVGETASVSEDDIFAEGKALVDDPASGV